jgi:hypothetical protein
VSKSSLNLLVSSHIFDWMWFSLLFLREGIEEVSVSSSSFFLFMSFFSFRDGFFSSLFYFVLIPHLFMPFRSSPLLFAFPKLGHNLSLFTYVFFTLKVRGFFFFILPIVLLYLLNLIHWFLRGLHFQGPIFQLIHICDDL